jgi:hypothetical protein
MATMSDMNRADLYGPRRRRTLLQAKSESTRPATEDGRGEVILSITALACGSVGALSGLFLGFEVFGFPICISTTIVGGVFGASLGRYLG